jgi:dipeptidyl aminopeptidase/acylaminoacyl peptidase
MRILSAILLLAALLAAPFSGQFTAFAQEEAPAEKPAPDPLHPAAVLTTGAIPLLLPAFHDDEMAGVELSDLFDGTPAAPARLDPAEGREFAVSGRTLAWESTGTSDGRVTFDGSEVAAFRYVAFYVTTDRWQKATLDVPSHFDVRATLDGQALKLNKKDGEEGAPPNREGEMTLEIGRHLVVLRTLADPGIEEDWSLEFKVTPSAEAGPGSLELSTDPLKHADIRTILNAPRISSASISPDGQYTAVSLGEYRDGKNRETWLELRRVKDGELVRVWRTGQAPSSPAWHPVGTKLSWQTSQDDATTIWLHDLETGSVEAVLEDLKELGGWAWAPDGESIVYSVRRSPDDDPRRVKRVLHPADRQSWWRGRSHLMQALLNGVFTRRLTAGPLSPHGWELSPDGTQMLFFTSEPDITNRPFSTSQLWLMDMETLAVDMILDDVWVGGATWSPDGKTLLLQGSPSAFDGLGRNLPEGVQANDYGGQLYLFDLESREPTAITLDLVPDVGWVEWSDEDGMIYARTTDTQYSTVWRGKPGETWEIVDTGMEYVNQFAPARDAPVAVVRGTSAATPNKLFAVDLKKNQAREILDPGVTWYEDVAFGRVDRWIAPLPDGQELDGFVYYPPDFDPDNTYPLIVYYYGGTSPVTRDFGGRYPKNVWAGQGYVVYVPNPSGATGYGQEFAARHVNDWGILTAGEVIEATKAFLAAHDFADPEAVGCIGASYGGFLTQYIITQTDIFAAAVSHAGISDISSYWGEGLWGYAYGARALANTFPWKDRDLYVEQSPLFHADKITTPLLLVHGDSDTNVPKGESDQMFTALKILGKEVEYVQIVGQDHHILDHEQRIVWNDTILAYFARYLKGRPDWWTELYPEPTDYR